MRGLKWVATVGTTVALGAAVPAHAETFLVNDTGDPGDGTCDASCTLRDAVQTANVDSEPDEIRFEAQVAGETTTLIGSALVVQAGRPLTISAPAEGYTISGNDAVRSFVVDPGGALTIDGLTLTRGRGTYGGAVYVHLDAAMTIKRSTLEDNESALEGGAIAGCGTLTIESSTLSGNTGGSHAGALTACDNVTIENSTLSGNTSGSVGAAITVWQGAEVSLSSVTIAFNAGEDAIFTDDYGGESVTAQNTIIANTIGGPNCAGSGIFISDGHNLTDDESCFGGANDLVGIDPQLQPLASNGGPTQTHALSASSPAINAGATELGADQRGVTRPQGTSDDIGAFELQQQATVPQCEGRDATIVGTGAVINGTPGDDVIIGTPGNNTINAGGGRDRICARGGDDTVDGGVGDDLIFGGFGNDTLRGNEGPDRLFGEDGRDSLDGGLNSDFCNGGGWTDTAVSCETQQNIP